MVESEKYKIKRGITMKKIKVILIGAGSRGQAYTDIMAELPGQFEVVGVAEPIEGLEMHAKLQGSEQNERVTGIVYQRGFTAWPPAEREG